MSGQSSKLRKGDLAYDFIRKQLVIILSETLADNEETGYKKVVRILSPDKKLHLQKLSFLIHIETYIKHFHIYSIKYKEN